MRVLEINEIARHGSCPVGERKKSRIYLEVWLTSLGRVIQQAEEMGKWQSERNVFLLLGEGGGAEERKRFDEKRRKKAVL